MTNRSDLPSVLVTGAGGYLGSETIKDLAKQRDRFASIVAVDVRIRAGRCEGVEYVTRRPRRGNQRCFARIASTLSCISHRSYAGEKVES